MTKAPVHVRQALSGKTVLSARRLWSQWEKTAGSGREVGVPGRGELNRRRSHANKTRGNGRSNTRQGEKETHRKCPFPIKRALEVFGKHVPYLPEHSPKHLQMLALCGTLVSNEEEEARTNVIWTVNQYYAGRTR